jgi:beta-glucosidase
MYSHKNALRAGLKIAIPTIVIAMLLMSMTTTSSFAARPPTPTPSPIPAGGACTSTTDCLSKMTLDEKIGQMTQANKNALTTPSDITTYALGSLLSGGGEGPNGSGGTATEWANMYDNFQGYALQTRLRIPLIYGVDAVHGHNNVYGAVIFPHHIGMGATRDAALVQQADQVTRDEVLGTGIDWVFAPCVCVPRDDRWGRTYEGYGEDPALVSSMGVASIKGFQGAGLSPTTVMATAKHYIADGGTAFGTGDSGYLIDQGDAQISETVLRAIHLPPYQAAVQNGVGSVMISYSSWNGLKNHGNQYLIATVLKGELGFQGIVISDWAGIDQLPGDYASDVRTAINAGIDMVMVPSNYKTFISTLRTEVTAGRVPMARIDDAVTRILNAKFALGLFSQPLTNRTYTAQVGSAAHRAVARQAVRESLVLLKNNGALPLSKTATYKLVVGGSHIDNLGNQMGGWSISWQGASGNTTVGTTFLQAIQAAVGSSVTVQNVGTRTKGNYSGDIGIVAIGETPYAEGRGDSSTLAVSSANAAQVTDICSRVTQCIVVLFSGRPLIINTQLNQANAFVAAWLPGTEGAGITDALFGDYGFVGKLPVTWPNAVTQEPINIDDGKTGLFPFGFGITPY